MGDCYDRDRAEVPTKDTERVQYEDKLIHKTFNVGTSNYSQFTIQPWDIWREYALNPWDADMVKRILRTKEVEGMTEKEARLLDYRKIKHICDERIAQLEGYYDTDTTTA